MPLKRADHHHSPRRTFWMDGRDMLAVFEARREFLERAAEREYDQAAKPTEIVLTEENYPRLRAGPC